MSEPHEPTLCYGLRLMGVKPIWHAGAWKVNVLCEGCQATQRIALSVTKSPGYPEGYAGFPDSLPDGWWCSGQTNKTYCGRCRDASIAEAVSDLLDVCERHGAPVHLLGGDEPDAPELDGEDVPPTDPVPPAGPVLPTAVDAPRAGRRRQIQRPEVPRLDPERPHILDENARR